MRRPKKESGGSNDRWLLTYSDMITLLMIFFIMMYVISNVNAQKFQQMANVLSDVFGNKSSGVMNNSNSILLKNGTSITPRINPSQVSGSNKNSGDSKDLTQLNHVKQELESYLNVKGLQGRVSVQLEERGLVIRLQDTILFFSGSATLTTEARNIIADISKTLNPLPNYIRIEGHTDNLSIHVQQFPSNWELSSARATNVVQELIIRCGISPDRLSSTGYGEYRPYVPNDTEYHRSMNRRVDILILKETYSQVEPTKLNSPTKLKK